MATAKKGKEAKAEKAEVEIKDFYVEVNRTELGKTTVVTHVKNVRTLGSFVRETVLDKDGNAISTSVVFVPTVKVKTKKGNKDIILDKGPKPKKDKAAKKEKPAKKEKED